MLKGKYANFFMLKCFLYIKIEIYYIKIEFKNGTMINLLPNRYVLFIFERKYLV